MVEFTIKNKRELKSMSLAEVEQYYREFRKYQYEQNLPIKGIEEKRENYKQIKRFLMIDKILSRRTVKIIGDQRIQTDRPKIYACTHIGRYDIEGAIESINEATWFLMGNPGETYLNFNGYLLDKHGVIYFDMDDSLDRHIAKETCIQVLKQRGYVFLFPEGAYNLDSLIPVMKLFDGMAEMAIESNADIIPMAIEQYRKRFLKHYYVNIGKNLNFLGWDLKDKEEISEIVRWQMASLKWDIWEKYGNVKRSQLPNNWYDAKNQFIDSIMCDAENGYSIEEIERTRYHEKNRPVSFEQVFSYLNQIDIGAHNAFLAKDVYTYQQNHDKILRKV